MPGWSPELWAPLLMLFTALTTRSLSSRCGTAPWSRSVPSSGHCSGRDCCDGKTLRAQIMSRQVGARDTWLRSSVIKTLYPEFPAALKNSKFHKCRFGGRIDIERAAETESTGMQYTIFLHFPESLALLGPPTVQLAALDKNIELPPTAPPIECAIKCPLSHSRQNIFWVGPTQPRSRLSSRHSVFGSD